MRSLLLLSTLVVLAACADDSRTTAPRAASNNQFVSDARSASQLPVAQGKPTDVVGFTKVTQVIATWSLAPSASEIYIHADCPTGTTAIGGGYAFDFGFVPTVLPPAVLAASPVGNSWGMTFVNNQPGALTWQVKIAATCAS
jgi:hypothetical protein